MSTRALNSFEPFVPVNAYFITGPQREREREQSNDLNISMSTYYEEWKFHLKTETLPAGAQEDIIDNRKTGKKQEVPHSVGPSSAGLAKHL